MNLSDVESARFSPDRKYRYLLTRGLGFTGAGEVMFIMLNPSTADEHRDDPTIRRCISFGKAWGFQTLYVTNLSPLRATYPKELLAAGPEPDDVWEENLDYIIDTALGAVIVVAAWGVHGAAEGRDVRVLAELTRIRSVHCLGTTKDGHPRHPLYVAAGTDPSPYTLSCHVRLPYHHGGKAL